MDDEQIVELYFARSEKAITETASKYEKYCYTIAYHILGDHNDAEECVSDTYLGAWNSIPPNRPERLSAFLGKITRRAAIRRWQNRHAAKRGEGQTAAALEELEECIPSEQNVEQEIEAENLRQIINEFVLSLPQTERKVFVCRYWYLDTISDICRQFNFSQSKVKSMLYRTRKKLQSYLYKEGVYVES